MRPVAEARSAEITHAPRSRGSAWLLALVGVLSFVFAGGAVFMRTELGAAYATQIAGTAPSETPPLTGATPTPTARPVPLARPAAAAATSATTAAADAAAPEPVVQKKKKRKRRTTTTPATTPDETTSSAPAPAAPPAPAPNSEPNEPKKNAPDGLLKELSK